MTPKKQPAIKIPKIILLLIAGITVTLIQFIAALGLVGLAIGLVIGGVYGEISGDNKLEPTKTQIAMEQYLKEKYDKDFVVEKPRYTNAGFGVDGTWQSTAHPDTEKDLTFSVGGTKNLNFLSDQYIAAIWSKEQTEKIQPEVSKIYGNRSHTKVAVKIIFSGDLARDATLASPTYDDAKKNYADKGFYYEYIIDAPSGADPSSEASKIYQLIELARKDEVGKIGVHYTEDARGGETICILESSKTASMTDSTEIKNCIQNKTKIND